MLDERSLNSSSIPTLSDYILQIIKGLSIYYVSSYNKAGSVGMLTNAYLREQGFIKKLMSYENQHQMR